MSSTLKSWFILLFLAITWGGSFILMKRSMFTADETPIFSSTQVGAMRMLFAGVALLPIALKAMKKLDSWQTVVKLLIVGLCGNFFPSFLFTYAETGISSGYAGMLNSCTPIFALLIGSFVFKDRLTSIQVIGASIGTIGVILLMLAGAKLSISGNWTHIAAIPLATLCYGISLNTIRHTLQGFKSYEIASLAFLLILLPSLIISYQQGGFSTIQTNPHAWEGLIALGILSLIGTALALILFNMLVAASSVLFASSVTYLIPIVAVIIGLSFGETISIWQVAAMSVVILGVFVANVLGRKQA